MLFPFFAGASEEVDSAPPLVFHNTLSGCREMFSPVKKDFVRLYTCGPTVYDYVHIGNLRAYILSDLVRRILRYNGYKVKQVMNVTDIGHLVGDGDVGEDKMALAVKRAGKPMTLQSMREVADFYINAFLNDLDDMNIKRPTVMPRPSEHIREQVALIETLMQKEYAYRTRDGVYFDTSRFSAYGALGKIDIAGLKEGARVEENDEKRNAADFALWKREDSMGWDSPWGRGFPGWHIECSAMAMTHLGKTIDIHTGGEDLARVHHNNEIAQSECATGQLFVRIWLHNAFLTIDDTKISKSLGNGLQLRQIKDMGHSPLAYRYWLLTSHYRSPINFSFEALAASETALRRLWRFYFEELDGVSLVTPPQELMCRFHQAINDDLNTPKALALVWDMVKDNSIAGGAKKAALKKFDAVLGLSIVRNRSMASVVVTSAKRPLDEHEVTDEIRTLLRERETLRKNKDFVGADNIRALLKERGVTIEDRVDGVHLYHNE